MPAASVSETESGSDEETYAVVMEAIVDLVLAMDEILQLRKEDEVRLRLRRQHLRAVRIHFQASGVFAFSHPHLILGT